VSGASLVLALIPARGGSKGLPGKNVRPLNGRPLIAYAVDAAYCFTVCR
jgi:CMP-N-acetylneuraminic acid synthetase